MLCGVRLPKLKVQSLTVQTNFARSFIPSIARLLQNSPGLKKLEVHATYVSYIKVSSPKNSFIFLEYSIKRRTMSLTPCHANQYIGIVFLVKKHLYVLVCFGVTCSLLYRMLIWTSI